MPQVSGLVSGKRIRAAARLDGATAELPACPTAICLRCPCLCLAPPPPALAKTVLLLCSAWRLIKPVQPFQHPIVTISSCPPQDPAPSKIKPGCPSQDPHPDVQPKPPASIIAPVLEVVPVPQ